MSDEPTPRLPELDGDGDEPPAFHAPWQARAFAVAVALSEEGAYEWSSFQERLAAEIDRDDGPAVPDDAESSEGAYYRQWVAALERLLLADGVLDDAELADRAREFADGDRDASEWVAGEDGHAGHGDHAHSHPH